MKARTAKRTASLRKTRAASRRRAQKTAGHTTPDWERLLSGLAGAYLAFDGIRKKNVSGVGMALVGGGLMYRGFSGSLPVNEAVQITMQMIGSHRNGQVSGFLGGLQKLMHGGSESKGRTEKNRAA